ncbi:MAG: protein kinase [Deltaproteobacteria bacterium]|nr:protein kinase [Deltaproteobacteria bacterium]
MECSSCHTPNIDNARFCAKCGALLPVADSVEADPLLGQVIKNTFRIKRMIGEGGMGRVYEGEQQMGTTTRKVAIKTLHPDLSRDPQIVARFNRECGTVAELEHPNTIQFFDFGQTNDGTLFIAMEFLEGPSIAKILETQGALESGRVEHIMKQICGSLAEAHKKGIVHRDLKPENVILITRAGEEDFVKVLDFGIAARKDATDAKKEQKLTQQGMVLGTPPYMSPEQFKGQELDARSDIYSLGVMAYEMLTGKLPFEAATPWEWATKHLTERPCPFEVNASAANIPGGMKTAILRALSKNKDERQSAVAEFMSELAGSDGGAVRASAASHAGTAAMAAPPMELLQAAPQYGPGPGAAQPPVPTSAGMAVPVQPQYQPPPMAPTRATGGSNNKPIIIGLIAILSVLVVVGLVVVIKKAGKGESDEGPIALTSSSSVTTIEPLSSAPPPPTLDLADAAKTAAPVKTTAPTPDAGTPSKGGPQGEEACKKARELAQGEQIEAAVNMYRACQNGGQTAPMTHQAIARNAGPAAQHARFRKDCRRAHSIADAASSIGAAGTSQAEAAQCK